MTTPQKIGVTLAALLTTFTLSAVGVARPAADPADGIGKKFGEAPAACDEAKVTAGEQTRCGGGCCAKGKRCIKDRCH